MPVTRVPDIEAAKRLFYREIDHAMTQSLAVIERQVKTRYSGPTLSASLSVGTGRLRAAVRREKKGGPPPVPIEGRVYMPPPSEGGPVYARIHETGGIIRARRAPYLRFIYRGQWRRVKSVRIPARPVWRTSAREVAPRVRGFFAAALARIRLATRAA